MTKIRITALIALTPLSMVATPGATAGQRVDRGAVFVGAGAGFGVVSKTEFEVRHSDAGGTVLGRIGIGVSPRISVMLEGEVHHLNDGPPRLAEGDRASPIFRTTYVLVSGQLTAGDLFFVRPGIGLGFHDIAFGINCVGGPTLDCASYGVTNEGSLAVGAAAGLRVSLTDRVGMQFEGVARWSEGEDSSSSRIVYGLQLVLQARF